MRTRLFHLKKLGFYNRLDLQAFCLCDIISLFLSGGENLKNLREVVLRINLL